MILSLVKKYIWVINILLIILIAYVMAGFINDKIKDEINAGVTTGAVEVKIDEKYGSINNKTSPRSRYDSIMERNLFGIGAESVSGGEFAANDQSAPNTSLNLELLGTFLRPDGDSIAIIKNLDNSEVDSYTEGMEIDIITSEKVEMRRIDNCRVVIGRRSKGSESILCNKDLKFASASNTSRRSSVQRRSSSQDDNNSEDGIKKVEDGVYQIERKMLDELLEDPSELINQARVIPQDDGLRFFGIRPSSVFFKIGLRNGDTLHRINEVALNDVQNALSVFTDLKDQNEFSIDFTRRGKKQSNQYSVY